VTSQLNPVNGHEDLTHTEYDSLITRLRLLAAKGAVEAAEILHSRDNKLVDLGLMSDDPVSDTDFDIFEEKREQNRRAKADMLITARVTLGLDPVVTIDDRYWGRCSNE
jgi:hypothetical protein